MSFQRDRVIMEGSSRSINLTPFGFFRTNTETIRVNAELKTEGTLEHNGKKLLL